MRLRFVWTRAEMLPRIIVTTAMMISAGAHVSRIAGSASSSTRASAMKAAIFVAADMKPVTLVGAPS